MTKPVSPAAKKGYHGLQRLHDHADLQKKFEEELTRLRKSGEEPVLSNLTKAAGVSRNYLDRTAKANPWAETIKEDFNALRSAWEKHGGSDYKTLKTILYEMVENGKRPGVSVVSEKAGKYSAYLAPNNKKLYPWQEKLRREIKKAQKAFDKQGLEIPEGYVRLSYQCQPLQVLVKQVEWGEAEITAYIDAAAHFEGKDIHFGSWLYRRWFRVGEGRNGIATYVDPSSFDILRALLIKGAILALSEISVSMQGASARAIEKYINWLNRTASESPTKTKQAEESYRNFTSYLQQVVKSHDPRKKNRHIDVDNFGCASAKSTQSIVLLMLAEAFTKGNKADIQGMTGNIEGDTRGDNEDETVIDIAALNKALSYYYQFFELVTKFLLEKRPYPYSVSLLEHHVMLIPPVIPYPTVLTPFNCNGRHDWRKYFDPDAAKLRDETGSRAIVMKSELYQRKNVSKRQTMLDGTVETLNTFRRALDEGNGDHSHLSRLRLGVLAMQAYFMVLLDVTGMNDSMLATLPCSDDDSMIVESNEESVNLRNIKLRASGKDVVFTIQRKFIKSFKIFLKLRRFVLDGHNCSTLFFVGTGGDARLTGNYKTGGYGVYAFTAHKSYYPDLQFFGSQTLRQFKKRWIMKKTNGRTYLAAKLLQHTVSVSQVSYPGQSKEESRKMMANYFDYQHSLTMEVNDSEVTGSGACKSHKQPEAQVEETPIKPDCNKKMTCLFCKHYRLKPVRQEIHKVLSMKYVIKEFSKLHAWSQAHFDDVTKPILDRIELLLEAITTKYPNTSSTIEELRKEVDMQNLTSYWQGVHERNWEAVW